MNNRRVVMHVITNFSARAGAETMLARLLHLSQEHRVVVVPIIDVSERNRLLVSNSAVVYKPLGCRTLSLKSPFDLARSILQLRTTIQEERPAAIFCWMYHAMVLGLVSAKMAGCKSKVFWNVRQSLDDPQSLSRSTRLALRAARGLSRQPDGIIYNSQRALELHNRYGYRNRHSIVIPNGVPAPRSEERKPRNARIIGIAGRFHPQKDYETFFTAAAKLVKVHPNIRFIAVGSGLEPENRAVTSLITRAGLPRNYVELKGEVDDMASFYQSIDALVLSSRTEGFPNVVAEAMSYSRPVVATDVGDAAALVADSGFICAPQDPDALANSIQKLVELPDSQYQSLCELARRRIELHYSLTAIAERYETLLHYEPT